MGKENKEIEPGVIDKIISLISQTKFGAVEIVIHDSKVVQVQKSEKFRFDKA